MQLRIRSVNIYCSGKDQRKLRHCLNSDSASPKPGFQRRSTLYHTLSVSSNLGLPMQRSVIVGL